MQGYLTKQSGKWLGLFVLGKGYAFGWPKRSFERGWDQDAFGVKEACTTCIRHWSCCGHEQATGEGCTTCKDC
jgi:hypothetical protein